MAYRCTAMESWMRNSESSRDSAACIWSDVELAWIT